jgi:hypothetical protein
MAYEQADNHLRLFAAIEDLRSISQPGELDPHIVTVPASRLCDYAIRRDSVVDLRIERLLRERPAARTIYAGAMERRSATFSRMAAAAGAGEVRTRLVGPHRLELIDEQDMAYLVVHLGSAGKPVEWIEVRTRDGSGGRVQFGKAIRSVLQLPLDHRFPELKAIDEAIRKPDCQIYLWP